MKTDTCPYCGEIVQDDVQVCIKCGKQILTPAMSSEKKRPLVVILIAIFLFAQTILSIMTAAKMLGPESLIVDLYSQWEIEWVIWVGTAITIGVALGKLVTGIGLWRLKNWARRLAIVFQIFGIYSNIGKLANAFKLGNYSGFYNQASPDYLSVIILANFMLVQCYIIYWLSKHKHIFG